eukprot:TRINITY_DN1172_c0_g1_i1.p1 TRINITY_DN1172_c0_g1~~TRINITY_DN1172_c0_g1_i1.p1  ORF type:complete len:483 (-),score=163.03 TRINITY_DN1172_c0_g1_i1:81-1529(-)
MTAAPITKGKVVLHTTLGDMEIELWSKEAPKACRNFVQLCMEGYYDDCIFHRVVKDFIVQTGDPTGTGDGGESIYGEPFADEFHSRLRYSHRGIVAMANSGPNSNKSQFFITLDATSELQRKNTIFGKIVGDTIYNLMKMNNLEVDSSDRPLYPPKITSTEILWNPFDDIIPRPKAPKPVAAPPPKPVGTKNKSLLSFGEEAEEEPEEEIKSKTGGKMKSVHHFIDDPNLKKEIEEQEKKLKMEKEKINKEASKHQHHQSKSDTKVKEEPKAKISKDSQKAATAQALESQMRELMKQRRQALDKTDETKGKDRPSEKGAALTEDKTRASSTTEDEKIDPKAILAEFQNKYKKGHKRKRGDPEREKKTLEKLKAFQNIVKKAATEPPEVKTKEPKPKKVKDYIPEGEGSGEDDDDDDEGWLTHKLAFQKEEMKAREPKNDDDGYKVIDPLANQQQSSKYHKQIQRLTGSKKGLARGDWKHERK